MASSARVVSAQVQVIVSSKAVRNSELRQSLFIRLCLSGNAVADKRRGLWLSGEVLPERAVVAEAVFPAEQFCSQTLQVAAIGGPACEIV